MCFSSSDTYLFFGVMKDISTNSKTNLALMQHMLTLRISLMNLR